MRKVLALVLTACFMVIPFAGCAQNTGTEDYANAAEEPTDGAAEKRADETAGGTTASGLKDVAIGLSLPTTADTHLRGCMNAIKWIEDAFPEVTLLVDEGAFSPEEQITSVENLIQSGAQIICLANYVGDASLPKISQLCEENGVYLVLWDSDMQDEDVKKMVEANPYYVCNTNENQYAAGYAGMEALASIGVDNVVLVAYGVGISTCDEREAGARDAAEALGVKVSYVIVAPEDPKKAMQDAMTTHPDINGLFILGGVDYATPMVSAIEDAGRTGDIKVGQFDLKDSSRELMKKDQLHVLYGGHIVTTMYAALAAMNTYYGTPLSEDNYKIWISYLSFNSIEDLDNYTTYVAGDIPPYNREELSYYLKALNPDLTLEKFQEGVSRYSIKDIVSRRT